MHPFLLSSFLHETSRLAFMDEDLTGAAALLGAVERIANQPEVTVAEFILVRACELRVQLVAVLGAEAAEREIHRGVTMTVVGAFEISRRYLGR